MTQSSILNHISSELTFSLYTQHIQKNKSQGSLEGIFEKTVCNILAGKKGSGKFTINATNYTKVWEAIQQLMKKKNINFFEVSAFFQKFKEDFKEKNTSHEELLKEIYEVIAHQQDVQIKMLENQNMIMKKRLNHEGGIVYSTYDGIRQTIKCNPELVTFITFLMATTVIVAAPVILGTMISL